MQIPFVLSKAVRFFVRSAVLMGGLGLLACSDAGPPANHVSITSPQTLMVGDAIQLTANVEGATGAAVHFEVSPASASSFLIVQQPDENHLYGVGTGSAQVNVSLVSDDAEGTLLAQDSMTVTVVPPPASNRPAFSQIEGGEQHTCALSSDGSTFCWGNYSGYRAFAPRCEENPLHGLPRVCHSVPVKLEGFPQFKYINLGTYSSCAITLADDAFCWDIGPYNVGNNSGTPATVPGGIKFKTLSVETGYPLNPGAEAEHVCGIASDGGVYCWRRGGSPTNPALVSAGAYTAVSVGGTSVTGSDAYRACALDNNGAAYCWGSRSLGDGNPAPSAEQTTPVAVAGGLHFIGIASESYSTCALSSDGSPYCWGGARDEALIPTAVPTSVRFTAISASEVRFCGIATDQSVYCWGHGEPQPPVVQVPGPYHFRSVTVGGPVSCGLTVEGPEVCWGGRGMGGVGDGVVDGVTTTTPTPVVGQRVWP
jgi:hypothetical protein